MPKNLIKQTGWRGWLWCLEAYLRLSQVSLALRFLGFDWLKPQLELNQSATEITCLGSAAHTGTPPITRELPRLLHEAIRLASRAHPMRPACLPKSLVLVRMLRGRGYKARAVLGVAKEHGRLASHAWVEVLRDEQWRMVSEPETVPLEFSRM